MSVEFPLFNSVTNIISVAQLYLTEANVFRAKEEFEKATQLYQRVIDISKDTEGEAADFGAIAKLKLAESYLSDNAEEAMYVSVAPLTRFQFFNHHTEI